MRESKIGLLKGIKDRMRGISLRKKLIISYGLVLIVPLTILGVYSVNLSQRLILTNGVNVLNNMTERANAMTEEKLVQMENVVTLCAYQQEMQRIYRNTAMTKFQLYLALKNFGIPFLQGVRNAVSSEIDELCVYSTRGLQNKAEVFRSYDQAKNEKWYESALNESGIKWHAENNRLYALCRIDSVSSGLGKEYYGVIYLSVDFKTMIRNCLEIGWDGYELEIRNDAGEVFYSGAYGIDKNDSERLTYSFRIPKAGMLVNYYVSRDSIAGYGQHLFEFNALIILLSVMVIILLVWMMSHRMFRRIELLKEKMLLVQKGDMNVRVENTYGDEVGVLTDTFQSMLSEIRLLIEKVKETEMRSGQLELRALRAQIDPHFLYNTLSYVNWLAIIKNEDEIGYVIRQISKFYRTCLNNGREFIHVDREMSNVEAYLEISLIMHSRSFDVVYEIDEDVYRYKMLCFLLQPLAENAVLHGIDKLSGERGRIAVRAMRREQNLIFEIENNGEVLTQADLEKLSQSKGYGVNNIQQRIHLCYGESYGVTFYPRESGGLTARVVLPCVEDDIPAQEDEKVTEET